VTSTFNFSSLCDGVDEGQGGKGPKGGGEKEEGCADKEGSFVSFALAFSSLSS